MLRIEHDRAFSSARLGDSEVELTLETSGPEQIEAIKRELDGGYVAEEVNPGRLSSPRGRTGETGRGRPPAPRAIP